MNPAVPAADLHVRIATCTPVEVPLRYAIAAESVRIAGGCWTIPQRAGCGLAWDAGAVERFRIQ
jgi:hypothetical protein